MKITNSNLSFKAGLIIDNTPKNKKLKSSQYEIIHKFNIATEKYPKYTVFWRFGGNGEKDRFELYNENSKSVSNADISFSNFFDSMDVDYAVSRLGSIFALLKLKEFYNDMISNLIVLRNNSIKALNKAINNPNISEEEKNKLANMHGSFIYDYSGRINSASKISQTECSSFMIENGLMDTQDELLS